MLDAISNLGERFARRSVASPSAPEPLQAFLVDTIHSARGPLAISSILGVLISFSAYAMVGDEPVFVIQVVGNFIVGVGRMHRLSIWQACKRKGLTAQDVAACDRGFMLWSALLALLLGLTCYQLTANAESPGAFALAVSLCTGFSISFATGSAGRPLTMAAQVAGLTGPLIFALLTLPVPLGGVWAALTMGLDCAALLVGRFTRRRIIALYRANEENRRLAETDILTGLMNRHAMRQVFARAIERAAARPRERLAVYLVDLDRFKQINDTLGHAAGDAVLVETGARLREAARGARSADVARMGGDEFMLLARLGEDEGEVEALARRVVDTLCGPFVVDGAAAPISGSLGVAAFSDLGHDAAYLMKCADRALYEAKRAGRGRYRLFDRELATRLVEDGELESALAVALEHDQLEAWYQPIHNLRSGEVAGYEALVRWRHPTLGLIMPDRFVSLAEQSGAIHRLGEIVLAKACREAATWPENISIAVNFSPKQFLRSRALVEAVRRELEVSGLHPSRLYLEITENFLMDDNEDTRLAIKAMEEMGVRFSLDDFGRGFSSLAYIQKYPFSKIKIDREFVRNIPADPVSSAIVASVCLLARRIGMSVVAEGVETDIQRRALSELGVDLAQGYLFGRPAPASNIKLVFAERRASG